MLYTITMLSVNPNKIESTKEILKNIGEIDSIKKSGVTIEPAMSIIGWSDFVLRLKGEKLDDLKETIMSIRKYLQERGIESETSTFVAFPLSSEESKN